MIESGYYPPGAEFDPRAPYNQPPSVTEQYEDEAYAKLDEQIANKEEEFIEWIIESRFMPDDPSFDAYEVADKLAEYQVVQNQYTSEMFEDTCQMLADYDADNEEAAYDDWCDQQYERMRDSEY